MHDIKIVKTSLHRIDLSKEFIGKRIPIGDKTDFDSYVAKLMEDMYDSPRYKAFRFISNETEVARQVQQMDETTWNDKSQVIAERLLRSEKIAQEEVQKIQDLRVGSLVQILAEIDGQKNIIITKVDHNAYLDEESLKKQLGLPVKQRVQKTCVVTFEDDTKISNMRLSDSNSKISKYWRVGFLEVEELNSSESNTLLAFNSIDKVLRKKVRKKSKSDFWTLRNAVISYFRTNKDCTFDALIESVFSNYNTDSKEIDIDDIKSELVNLPKKHSFDSQFEISSEAIKARICNKIKLAENLELNFTGVVEGLESLIDTGESSDGRKYIKIFSENGYSEFKKTVELSK